MFTKIYYTISLNNRYKLLRVVYDYNNIWFDEYKITWHTFRQNFGLLDGYDIDGISFKNEEVAMMEAFKIASFTESKSPINSVKEKLENWYVYENILRDLREQKM
jgi:hypothetical protein